MVLKDLTVIIGINRVFFILDLHDILLVVPLNQEMEARTRLSDKTTYLTSSWLSPLNQEREVRTRLSPFLLLYQNLILLYVDRQNAVPFITRFFSQKREALLLFFFFF